MNHEERASCPRILASELQSVPPLEVGVPFPEGRFCIQASAGTGKSFSLVALYLRQLLGLGGGPALPVSKILVLTFTIAATQELRERIRAALQALIEAFAAYKSGKFEGWKENPVWAAIFYESCLDERSEGRLLEAKKQLEVAPVYTIHGFCGRILRKWAFETGYPPPSESLMPSKLYLWNAVVRFWFGRLHHANLLWREALLEAYPEVEGLVEALGGLADCDPLEVEGAWKEEAAFLEAYQAHIDRLAWLKAQFLTHPWESWEAAGVHLNSAAQKQIWEKSAQQLRQFWSKERPPAFRETLATTFQSLYRISDRFKASLPPPFQRWFECLRETWTGWVKPAPSLLFFAWRSLRHEAVTRACEEGELSFRDLLIQAEQALEGRSGAALAEKLRSVYPMALVDEFQDTDPRQYRILNAIYPADPPKGRLIFIGDPKQAIYGFRGGDLFTYLKALDEVHGRYRLPTNWRASCEMTHLLNALWSRMDDPFLSQKLPFYPSDSPFQAGEKQLLYRGKAMATLAFHLPNPQDRAFSQTEYRKVMAQLCAASVADWVQAIREGDLTCLDRGESRLVGWEELAILVRNHLEAQAIKEALWRLGVPSFYGSQQEDAFRTPAASRLYRLLRGWWHEETPRLLAGDLMASEELWASKSWEEVAWQRWEAGMAAAFQRARAVWLREGVLPAFQSFLNTVPLLELWEGSGKSEALSETIYRLLTGLARKESEGQFSGGAGLLAWFEQALLLPSFSQQESVLGRSQDQAVQIVTVFKAKGLEYLAVWIPFACSVPRFMRRVYHKPGSDKIFWSPELTEPSRSFQREELLAEEMRLFYVAATRATVHLAMGVAPVRTGSRASPLASSGTQTHLSGLGRLIQKGRPGDASFLYQSLEQFIEESGYAHRVERVTGRPQKLEGISSSIRPSGALCAPQFREAKRIYGWEGWRLTSYSGLCKGVRSEDQGDLGAKKASLALEEGSEGSEGEELSQAMGLAPDESLKDWSEPLEESFGGEALAPPLGSLLEKEGEAWGPPERLEGWAAFPKGAKAGNCLHQLLELWDFQPPYPQALLSQTLQQFGFEQVAEDQLRAGLEAVVRTPLLPDGFCLSHLNRHEVRAEMNFFLSLNRPVSAETLEEKVRLVSGLSTHGKKRLNFSELKGFLCGFLDLVFCHKGKFYLLDYKSNFLGPERRDYSLEKMEQAMIEHRYDLQLSLYGVALQRYLRSQSSSYRYEHHFGGMIYFFLRGAGESAQYGVFFRRPEAKDLLGLERYLSGESEESGV